MKLFSVWIQVTWSWF